MTQLQTIDVHAHIAHTDFIPPRFIDGLVTNAQMVLEAQGLDAKRTWIERRLLKKFDDRDCDELVSEMDDAGIAQSVLLAADFTYAMPDCPLTMEENLAHHAAVMARHPGRLLVFTGVDPRWGQTGLDLFERSIRDYGFHGIKLYPPCGYSPSDHALFPYFEIAAEWQIPVLLHVGGTCPDLNFEYASPVLLDEAARTFPNVDFILAHASVSCVEDCAMQAAFRPNVFLDVSGFQTADLSMLSQLFNRRFMHKVMFGTDWPFFRLQGTQKSCLDQLTHESGPMRQLRSFEEIGFLGQTARQLLSKRKALVRS